METRNLTLTFSADTWSWIYPDMFFARGKNARNITVSLSAKKIEEIKLYLIDQKKHDELDHLKPALLNTPITEGFNNFADQATGTY